MNYKINKLSRAHTNTQKGCCCSCCHRTIGRYYLCVCAVCVQYYASATTAKPNQVLFILLLIFLFIFFFCIFSYLWVGLSLFILIRLIFFFVFVIVVMLACRLAKFNLSLSQYIYYNFIQYIPKFIFAGCYY
jgi:hypothetical protein